MSDSAAKLNYAPPPRGLARRTVRRRLIVAAILLGLLCFGRRGYQAGRAVFAAFANRAEFVRGQDGSARYTAPANLLIASDDPNDVAALGAVVGYCKVDLKPTFASGGLEQDLHLKAQASRAAVFYVHPQNRIGFLFLSGFETSVFAHARRASADSEKRLVKASVAHWSTGARYPNDRTLEVDALAQRFAGYWPYTQAEGSAVARMHIKVGRDECFRVLEVRSIPTIRPGLRSGTRSTAARA
jgi:hypothetical protein